MAIKTFTAGSVLTASDTNTFLANSGLVYVGQSTGTATSLFVDNVFTSTYQNYRIVVSLDSAAANGQMLIRFRASGSPNNTSNYFWGGYYITFGSGTVTGEGATTAVTSGRVGAVNTAGSACSFDLFAPQVAQETLWVAPHQVLDTYIRHMQGYFNATTQFDGIEVYNNAGGNITGAVRVYGYRQA